MSPMSAMSAMSAIKNMSVLLRAGTAVNMMIV